MSHYYSEYQENRLNIKKFKVIIKDIAFEFHTAGGVFSKNKLDKGTQILADNMIINENNIALDFGCGIGILGIVIAKCYPNTRVIMTDINKRAVELARRNIKLNSIENAEARQGNLFEPIREKFNTIIINPPMKAGYKICFKIIEESKDFLLKGGTLQLVALHNKGGKKLSEKMREIFSNVKELSKKSGYRVYVSEN